ncbi:MAG: hypothetical protein LC808_22825 [Actinobacteria bacterium]|nr:hypothetical protein [Actinomycetota bacterium]
MVDSETSSGWLHSTDGVIYRIAAEEHAVSIARLLASSFTHEPMTRVLGLTTADLHKFVRRFIPECTVNGLSVVAVSEEPPNEVVGASINRDFRSPLPPGVPDDFPRFAPIFEALLRVDERYEAQVGCVEPGQAVHLWMVGVHLGGRFARRGVGRHLFRASAQLAEDRAFERCISECTSYFSQRSALGAGYVERVGLMYQDFLFDGLPVFASIPEPHRKVGLYERTLARACPSPPSLVRDEP